MVMSIGWNPYFDNTEKTIVSVSQYSPFHVQYLSILVYSKRHRLQEPWLLHDFGEDFYGEELRLVIVGYIRPEVIQDQTIYTAEAIPLYVDA